jgi:hypothetical protein
MAAKLKDYQVWANCHRQVALTIKARTLEEALEKSKELEGTDFVTVNGECVDADTQITGVLEV